MQFKDYKYYYLLNGFPGIHKMKRFNIDLYEKRKKEREEAEKAEKEKNKDKEENRNEVVAAGDEKPKPPIMDMGYGFSHIFKNHYYEWLTNTGELVEEYEANFRKNYADRIMEMYTDLQRELSEYAWFCGKIEHPNVDKSQKIYDIPIIIKLDNDYLRRYVNDEILKYTQYYPVKYQELKDVEISVDYYTDNNDNIDFAYKYPYNMWYRWFILKGLWDTYYYIDRAKCRLLIKRKDKENDVCVYVGYMYYAISTENKKESNYDLKVIEPLK